MQQKRVMPDREVKNWTVDTELLAKVFPNYKWLKNERFLQRDICEMNEYLPHWIITIGNGYQLLRSACCQDNLAPFNNAFRCIRCDQINSVKPTSLLWLGLLPINLEGREKALKKIEAAQDGGKLNYPIISPNGKRHLMVPVIAEYPQNWPYSPPQGHYLDRQFIDALKLKPGHQSHVIGQHSMCLYHATQWNDSFGIMHVVANRMAPHAFALLRLGNDEESIDFFVTKY